MSNTYYPPNFESAELRDCPPARFAPAPADGVVPDEFYSTTNFPTYVRLEHGWVLAVDPRMDAVMVREGDHVRSTEPRNVREGMLVLVGSDESGAHGFYVNDRGFLDPEPTHTEKFSFMSGGSSRERPTDYSELATIVESDRQLGGYSVWVLGPAVVHAGAREAMTWLVQNGYVGVLLAGNALAAHDLEMGTYRTSLGVTMRGHPVPGGHRHHIATINRIRALGSIEAAIESGMVTDGIMHACVWRGIPYVLAGSIRDDGPLPGVLTDALEAQMAMRAHTKRATMAVMLATALHSIATGNMLPTFYLRDGVPQSLPIIAVDQDEFILTKLVDRGTHQAFGISRNASDFLQLLVAHLKVMRHEA